MTIITNHKERQFRYGYEVPERVMKSFDYLDEHAKLDGFIHYKKRWYHIDDFMRLNKPHMFNGDWTGYISDSYFSGILIKVSNDGETYKIATYIS